MLEFTYGLLAAMLAIGFALVSLARRNHYPYMILEVELDDERPMKPLQAVRPLRRMARAPVREDAVTARVVTVPRHRFTLPIAPIGDRHDG